MSSDRYVVRDIIIRGAQKESLLSMKVLLYKESMVLKNLCSSASIAFPALLFKSSSTFLVSPFPFASPTAAIISACLC